MLLDRRKTRIFHVNMAFLLLLNAIVKIKYYITKGSKKDFFFFGSNSLQNFKGSTRFRTHDEYCN